MSEIVSIRRFNLLMGLLHLAQGAVMILVSNDFALPVTSSFLVFDPRLGELAARPETLLEVRLGPLVASFLLISAAAHFYVSTISRDHYRRWLEREINPARWIEYSVSSSVMIVVIAMLVGIYDVVSLIAIFAVNASMILFGWTMELQDRKGSINWLPYWFGVFAGLVPWIAISIYLFGAGEAPTFVYFIYLSLFVFFAVFAVVMVLQYRGRGRWADYLVGERAYIWLSLIAKSALAWQVFAGTLRPV